MTEFGDIVDTQGLSPDEEARLRRVHELLVEAGPPADLPPTLAEPSAPPEAEIIQFPLLPRRRWAVAFVATAAVVAVAFGGGYLFGHSKSPSARFAARSVVPMHPVSTGAAGLAVLKLAGQDSVGNWPMEMAVTGLPKQSARGAYYELWLTKGGGKPVALCGSFRVHGKTTTVRFSVPYELSRYDGWVVTAVGPHEADPGRVVLTT